MKRRAGLTATQEILLAAADLADQGLREFTEWDLTVAAWKRNKNRFGSRGYEDRFPDHKRVMMEIMAKSKKENPLRQGWLQKVRANYYCITSLGLAEAEKMKRHAGETGATVRSAQPIYDTVAPYVLHPVFRKFVEDSAEPRTWLEAEAFLGLTRLDAMTLEDRLRTVENAGVLTVQWMEETGQAFIRSGAAGGKRAISRTDAEKLSELVNILKARFKVQMEAIRHRAQE